MWVSVLYWSGWMSWFLGFVTVTSCFSTFCVENYCPWLFKVTNKTRRCFIVWEQHQNKTSINEKVLRVTESSFFLFPFDWFGQSWSNVYSLISLIARPFSNFRNLHFRARWNVFLRTVPQEKTRETSLHISFSQKNQKTGVFLCWWRWCGQMSHHAL